MVNTDDSIEDLYNKGVIPSRSKYIEVYFPDELKDVKPEDDEVAAMIQHVQFLKFDDVANPKRLVIDHDLLAWAFKEDLRRMRGDILEQLDSLQVRALLKNRQEIIDQIEADKQRLRDLPETVDTSKVETIRGLLGQVRFETGAEYVQKYNEALK